MIKDLQRYKKDVGYTEGQLFINILPNSFFQIKSVLLSDIDIMFKTILQLLVFLYFTMLALAASGVVFETDSGKVGCLGLGNNGGKVASEAIDRGVCKQVEHDREKGIIVKDCDDVSKVYDVCARNKGHFYSLDN